MTAWPHQRDADAFYGNPRDPRDPTRASAKWESANLVLVTKLPFVMTYDGRPVSRIRCHRLVADPFRAVLEDIWQRSGRDQRVIDGWGMSVFGGSYNYRLKRGGTSLSMHAYAAAFDFDPARNGLGDSTPHFAKCPEVLAAWQASGAVWGGPWSRPDGMHWQFARV